MTRRVAEEVVFQVAELDDSIVHHNGTEAGLKH